MREAVCVLRMHTVSDCQYAHAHRGELQPYCTPSKGSEGSGGSTELERFSGQADRAPRYTTGAKPYNEIAT